MNQVKTLSISGFSRGPTGPVAPENSRNWMSLPSKRFFFVIVLPFSRNKHLPFGKLFVMIQRWTKLLLQPEVTVVADMVVGRERIARDASRQ